MPEHDFWVFLELTPLLIFKDAHIDGTVYRLHVAATDEFEDDEAMDDEPPDLDAAYLHKAAISLNPRILDEDQSDVGHVVAHEIGHLVLPTGAREFRVDRYAARLGFPPPPEMTTATAG